MPCPSCGHRKARRDCPALGHTICSHCCGTKRLVEIACPESCAYLSVSRANPAAVVRRQQEADVARLLPTIQSLTERQHQLLFLFLSVIARHQPEGLARLVDSDVAEAAAAVAATLETAANGLVYEHAAQSMVADRLARELTALLQKLGQEGATVYDREAAMALRAIEQGAKGVSGHDGDDYLGMVRRLLQINQAGRRDAAGRASSIILP